jgi:hypothetical protein
MTHPASGPRPADPRTPEAPAPEKDAAGDQELDRAVAELGGLDERPLTEHVAVFEQMHAALGRALADGLPVDGAPAADRA